MNKRTNYNNFNYNNDNNDIIITNKNNITVCEADVNEMTSSFSLTSKGEVKEGVATKINTTVCAANQLPEHWKFAKADLFANGDLKENKYKVSLSICRKGKMSQVRAQLNSPFRHMKRGLGEGVWSQSKHYQTLTRVHQDLTRLQVNPRASKVYLSNGKYGKGSHVVEFSVILANLETEWCLFVFYRDQQFQIDLKGGHCLTLAQRNKNIIATGMIQADTQRHGIHADDIWED